MSDFSIGVICVLIAAAIPSITEWLTAMEHSKRPLLPKKYCKWELGGDDTYTTGCGNDFHMIDPIVYTEWAKYCPHCGGVVKEGLGDV